MSREAAGWLRCGWPRDAAGHDSTRQLRRCTAATVVSAVLWNPACTWGSDPRHVLLPVAIQPVQPGGAPSSMAP
eukprot:366000-Chlamydomonas_euryale.AAC.69